MIFRSENSSSVDYMGTGSEGRPGLKFSKMLSGDKCKLSVTGEIKHEQAHKIYEKAVDVFESGSSHLLFDFSEVTYADTIGLQNLVRVYKYVQAKSGLSFRVFVPDGELMMILQTCRFDKFMEISSDESILTEDAWDKS